jgi:hypothetical protein
VNGQLHAPVASPPVPTPCLYLVSKPGRPVNIPVTMQHFSRLKVNMTSRRKNWRSLVSEVKVPCFCSQYAKQLFLMSEMKCRPSLYRSRAAFRLPFSASFSPSAYFADWRTVGTITVVTRHRVKVETDKIRASVRLKVSMLFRPGCSAKQYKYSWHAGESSEWAGPCYMAPRVAH